MPNLPTSSNAATKNCLPCASIGPVQDSPGACAQGWILREEFQLSVQKPVPAAIAPEPILRGIDARGYYIWRSGYAGQPKGTSQ
jgi:hypothetical protein